MALLPGMAAAGQRLPVRRALEARAGQVVQGDGGLQVEQVGGALEETRLDRVAVAQQAVAGVLQGVPAHGLAVAAERLAQGAALAHPGAAADGATRRWVKWGSWPLARGRVGSGGRTGSDGSRPWDGSQGIVSY